MGLLHLICPGYRIWNMGWQDGDVELIMSEIQSFNLNFFLSRLRPHLNPSVDPHPQDSALREVQVDKHERERK